MSSLANLLLVPLLFLALLCRASPPTPYNITLSDQSPYLTYNPSRSGPSASTWNSSYTSSPWTAYAQQTLGQGTSYHYSTASAASLSFGFVGTAFYVYGSAGSSGNVAWGLDGAAGNVGVADGLIGYQEGLKWGWHNVSLGVGGSGGVNLTGVTLTMGIQGTGSANLTQNTLQSDQSTLNSEISIDSYNNWEVATEVGGSSNVPYNRIDTHTPYSTLSLQPPNNTSLVLLFGSVNFDHGEYSVHLDSTGGNSTVNDFASQPLNQTFAALSPWTAIDQVTYLATLDPGLQYTITVEFLGANSSQYWDFAGWTYITTDASPSPAPTAKPKATHIGAIVGGAVGGVAALALLGGLIYFFCIRRKKGASVEHAEERQPFDVDTYEETTDTAAYRDSRHAYDYAALGAHGQSRPVSYITPLLPQGSDAHSSAHYDSSPYANPLPFVPEHNRYPSSDSKAGFATPSPHTSPGFASQAGNRMSMLSVANSTDEPGTAHTQGEGYELNPPSTNTAKRRSLVPRPAERPVTQEMDAGRVEGPGADRGEVVPPRYDPSWAEHNGPT